MRFRPAVLAALVVLMPTFALAHPGHGGGWMSGFAHPFGGFDHLLAMVAVGLWAARQPVARAAVLPLTFMGAMAVGGLIGSFGLAMPFAEPMIVGSAMIIAACALFGLRSLFAPSLAVIAFAGVMHGYAHGQEVPTPSSLLTYGAGFLAGTALLHAAGFALGRALTMRARATS